MVMVWVMYDVCEAKQAMRDDTSTNKYSGTRTASHRYQCDPPDTHTAHTTTHTTTTTTACCYPDSQFLSEWAEKNIWSRTYHLAGVFEVSGEMSGDVEVRMKGREALKGSDNKKLKDSSSSSSSMLWVCLTNIMQ